VSEHAAGDSGAHALKSAMVMACVAHVATPASHGGLLSAVETIVAMKPVSLKGVSCAAARPAARAARVGGGGVGGRVGRVRGYMDRISMGGWRVGRVRG
jgi:hypothetical protein